jgi:hypothetical protein
MLTGPAPAGVLAAVGAGAGVVAARGVVVGTAVGGGSVADAVTALWVCGVAAAVEDPVAAGLVPSVDVEAAA